MANSSSSSSGSDAINPPSVYASGIQSMMHAYGDCASPLLESAQIIEKELLSQLRTLVLQVYKVAVMRQTKILGVEDFVFLIRNDRMKFFRLVRYLEMIDKSISVDEDNAAMKRRRMIDNLISTIDNTGELLTWANDKSFNDVIRFSRLKRAELQTLNMSYDAYKNFHQSRQLLFGNPKRPASKLKDWVMDGLTLPIDIKWSPTAIETLAYFANETIKQLMDFCFVILHERGVTHYTVQTGVDKTRTTSEATNCTSGVLERPPLVTTDITREALRRYGRSSGPFQQFRKEQLFNRKRKLMTI